LADKLFKIFAVYLSPSCTLIEWDLSACFGRGLPVLMTGDLKAKYVDFKLAAERETVDV